MIIVAIIIVLSMVTGCTKGTNSDVLTGSSTTVLTTQPLPVTTTSSTYQTTIKTPIVNVPTVKANKAFPGTVILGSPTDSSITVSLLDADSGEMYIQYGKTSGDYSGHTGITGFQKDIPADVDVTNLDKDTQYYYRVCYRLSGETDFSAGIEATFHTQRATGDTFSFGIQADSHPERVGKMFDSDLYMVTMNNVKALNPDFYLSLGDDFSIDPLITKNQLNQQTVNAVYANQRNYLSIVGSSSPLFLVNGNHEEAAKYLLNGTANNAAVYAGKARIEYFPLPAPGAFYSGDTENVPFVGLPKDYYSWTWGNALFVVIDFYWHSSVAVDNVVGSDNTAKNRNMWDVTLGDTQYKWLEQTLANSNAKYKFVFTHHVLGTGRGGIELANEYEWGGQNKNAVSEFSTMRPGWDLPIQQLMAKYKVTIYFQGHDHLFAQQQLGGVTYQEVPCPADPTYTAFNSDAYSSGNILPNSGFLNVTVSASQVKVDYISSYLPKDETVTKQNGQVTYSYTIKGK